MCVGGVDLARQGNLVFFCIHVIGLNLDFKFIFQYIMLNEVKDGKAAKIYGV